MTRIIYILLFFEYNDQLSKYSDSIILKIINVYTKNVAVLSANGYGREKTGADRRLY